MGIIKNNLILNPMRRINREYADELKYFACGEIHLMCTNVPDVVFFKHLRLIMVT